MTHAEADTKGGCIRTYSGRFISLLAPAQEDIILGDVAHHLALLNRYTGATPTPYSVAQHSVLVSHLVEKAFALEGLFHDATEAYYADMNRPLKHSAGMEEYVRLEEEVMYPAIAKKFGLPPQIGPEIKCADMLAYKLECVCLFGERIKERLDLEAYVKYKHLVEPFGWRLAEEEFLDRYHQLTERTLG